MSRNIRNEMKVAARSATALPGSPAAILQREYALLNDVERARMLSGMAGRLGGAVKRHEEDEGGREEPPVARGDDDYDGDDDDDGPGALATAVGALAGALTTGALLYGAYRLGLIRLPRWLVSTARDTTTATVKENAAASAAVALAPGSDAAARAAMEALFD